MYEFRFESCMLIMLIYEHDALLRIPSMTNHYTYSLEQWLLSKKLACQALHLCIAQDWALKSLECLMADKSASLKRIASEVL